MLQICDSVLTEPLSIIFKTCIDSGVFPNTSKMSHIIPIHKKNDKCSLNNYCPVSLLAICGKILESTIFNDAFLFLENNNLLINNMVLGLMIPVSISFYQLFIVFTQNLIIIQHLK